jgi:hypothetical protein
VILVNGFPAEGHRTKNVVFENIKLPSAAIVEVDQAEDVTFTNVLNAEGEKPVFKISRSDRISY